MNLIIKDELPMEQVQSAFNVLFPYLKLEFFSKLHETGQATGLKFKLNPTAPIKNYRTIHGSDEIRIEPQMTANELEQLFATQFGLGVQVFRRMGNATWIETIATDDWTLEGLNTESEALLKVRKDRTGFSGVSG